MPARHAPHRSRSANARAAAAASLAALLAGCGVLAPSRFVGERAVPPERLAREVAGAAPAEAAPSGPAVAPPARPAPRSLAELVDRALATDPATRAVWQDARAAAAASGARRTLYLPSVSAGATLQRQETGATPSRAAFHASTYGASAQLTWLLLDLGGRAALVDEADSLLLAARLAEHAAVADLVLRVQQTYYQHLGARALVAAEAAAVRQAEESLAAAEGRRAAGVATVADVLQARTALSQARLTLQRLEGQALAVRGALAILAALPPTAELELGELPAEVDAARAAPEVEALLAEAEARSPELASARARARAADARGRAAARAYSPLLSFQTSASRSWYLEPSGASPATTWSVGLALQFPLLEGLLKPAYDALAARAAADAARARAEAAGQEVTLGVWTSFQAFRTAARGIETSRDLLASAEASAEVARGRYREGVGSILDLLAAQAAFETARAEDVRARADFLISLAVLARATGRLDLPAAPGAPVPPEGTP
jgi:outer membrane protein